MDTMHTDPCCGCCGDSTDPIVIGGCC